MNLTLFIFVFISHFFLLSSCGKSVLLKEKDAPAIQAENSGSTSPQLIEWTPSRTEQAQRDQIDTVGDLSEEGMNTAQSERSFKLQFLWASPLSIGDESLATLMSYSKQTQQLTDLPLFELYLWMPDMGHGSYPINIERISKGIYRLKDMYFTMPGLWHLHIKVQSLPQNPTLDTYWIIEL